MLYHITRFLVRLVLLLTTRLQVRGKGNIPRQGSLLIVVNHLNLADPPLVSVSLNREAMFMAKEELFRSRISNYFIRKFGAFPVRRGQPDRKALKQAEKILADGFALVMFPEASRSQDGQLQSALPGSALIALRSGSPILPIGISGTEKMKGPFWMLHRPRITVNIGQTFHLPLVNGKITSTELVELTSYIMGHIAELLPANQRGIYVKQGEANAT
ncbi:lysophospholipid acyltransferase family protein [Chloroflexota bacterium]